MLRSAAAMSGRRSSSCEGSPMGMGGGAKTCALTGMENEDAGLPISMAMACSYCARDAEIRGRGFRALERGLRLDHRYLVVDSIFVARLLEIVSFAISGDGLIQNALQLVLAAKLEVELSEAGLLGQALVLEIGGRKLRLVLLRADGIANSIPQVGLPGCSDGKGNGVEGPAAG